MSEIEKKLAELAQEEAELAFTSFSAADAMAIGNRFYEKAKAEGKNIAVQISLNGKMLFHMSMDGCSPDNDEWLRRKENMVYRLHQSSYRTAAFCEMMGVPVLDFYCLDKEDYAPAPGGFPISIKGTGCVGAICCGGMMPQQDHQFVVDVLREYLHS